MLLVAITQFLNCFGIGFFLKNRQLTPTEVRIGNLLSAAPTDVNMKTGFKEFRQLIAVASISPDAKFDFATSANSALLPSRPPSCGSLGRGLKGNSPISFKF